MRHFEERQDPRTKARYLAVTKHGVELQNDPVLNKGTCFPPEERRMFGLEALLPPNVATPEEQEARAYGNYRLRDNDLQRYLFLTALQDRNETLFHRMLLHHIEEMAPIVYTPTVGRACESYSRIYRRPRGLYITLHQRGRIAEMLREAPIDECRVIVATDNEAILGLGDLGVGGMGIPIGKLTLYTAGAGIHPASCLPIDLDVGTDNQSLLEDPLYLGIRQPRERGDAYFALLDELVEAVAEVFPGALMQWEDFANDNAFRILQRYRRRLLSFDDDIQGTGAVVAAGILAALRQTGRTLDDERAVFYGAGAAGGGCALALRAAMVDHGMTPTEAARRIVCLDSRGLILADRPGVSGHKAELAADPALVAGWTKGPHGTFGLAEVVAGFKPTILVGMSGRPDSFSKPIVDTMFASCPRPIVFPLSNPNRMAEATPANLLRWTNGAAVVATGSPFPPVEIRGVTYEIGQANNVLIFPGAGLGALAAGARWLPDEAFLAAARSLFEFAAPSARVGAPIFPSLQSLREVSRAVALGVARALVTTGAAPHRDDRELEQRIEALTWNPRYLPYRPAAG